MKSAKDGLDFVSLIEITTRAVTKRIEVQIQRFSTSRARPHSASLDLPGRKIFSTQKSKNKKN